MQSTIRRSLLLNNNTRRWFTTAPTTCNPSSASSIATATPTPTRRGRPELPQSLQSITIQDLITFDPSIDLHPSLTYSPPRSPSQPFPTTITHINQDSNDPTTTTQPPPSPSLIQSTLDQDDHSLHLAQQTHLTPSEIRSLFRFPLIVKRVVSMKSKGKMPSMYALVVVGNGQGLVGLGEGKDETANKAVSKAFNQAVRSIDFVHRYEERTVSGTMQSNFGTTKIQMRSRPPGFGLRVNHFIHQVAKAAGISDLSAKVYGSRNGTRVIKLAVAMLHGGTTPVDMGGFGHAKGQRRNKKTQGMQTAEEVARSRGRKAITL